MNNTQDITWAKFIASIIFELVLGLAGGFAFGFVGAILVAIFYKVRDPSLADIVFALLGFAILYTITMPLIVYLTGRFIFKQRSSIWMCLLASVCGMLAVLALAEPLRLNVVPQILMTSFLLLPLILTVIAFNYSVKPKLTFTRSKS